MISHHRTNLNAALTRVLPLTGRSLEIGNGAYRRGLDLGATYTLDAARFRRPSVQADASRIPFQDGLFATTVCCETLQYVDNPRAVMHEIGRVTEPYGRVIISVPQVLRRDHASDRHRFTATDALALLVHAHATPLWIWRLTGTLSALLHALGLRIGWDAPHQVRAWDYAYADGLSTGWLVEGIRS